MSTYDIFISYRRDGGESLACLLSMKLSEKGFRVFYDVESLRSGKFNDEIYKVISDCTDVLVILPVNALERCENEEDWVRKEVEFAIEQKKNIIPIMMRGFQWPKQLPEKMRELPHYNGLTANMEYFDASFKKVLNLLDSRLTYSLVNSHFVLLYYTFSTYYKRRLVYSDLIIDDCSHASLMVNLNQKTNKYEYTYRGRVIDTPQNFYIQLKNEDSTEMVNIYLYKSAGNPDRFIGILTGLTASMSPVSFKCACFSKGKEEYVNHEVLCKILLHNNHEWNENLLVLESSQTNLFYSDMIYEQ